MPHDTRVSSPRGSALPSVVCPTAGTWLFALDYGYLNRFADGKCGWTVRAVTLPSAETTGVSVTSLTLPAMAYMEASVTVAQGFALHLPSTGALTDANSGTVGADGGDLVVNGRFDAGAGATMKLANASAPPVIYVSGEFDLTGSAGQQVVVTSAGASPAPGDWGRVEFFSGSSGTISYAHISYAGARRKWAGCCNFSFQAGILVAGAAPTITNTIVDHGAGNGIEVVNPGDAVLADPLTDPTLVADTLTDNAGWAVHYDYWPDQLTGASGPEVSSLVASGNGHDLLGVAGGTFQASGEWHGPGIPIRTDLGQPIVVPAGMTWTVDAGTTIQFTPPDPYWGPPPQTVFVSGTLNVNGTANANVVLTSGQPGPAPGDWGRIEFDPGSTGTISYAHISYAGALREVAGFSHAAYATEILTIAQGPGIGGSGTANPTISGTIFDHSAGNDAEAVNGALPVLDANSYLAVPSSFYGVTNDGWNNTQPLIWATCSWWDATSGPSSTSNPVGTGTGVSSGVTFSPFATSGVFGCTPGAFVSLAPVRVLDTRVGNGAPKAAVGAGQTLDLQVTGRGGVPASDVGAVVVNVTVTQPTKGGFVTVYPSGAGLPTVSNLNFGAGQTVPNLVVVKVGAGGKIAFYNGSSGTVQLVADVAGYYLS